jgi:hypothetical protein
MSLFFLNNLRNQISKIVYDSDHECARFNHHKLVSVASVVVIDRRQNKRLFLSCVKSFDMEQRAMIKCYFLSGKTATQVYQDLKNVYYKD